MRYFGTGQNRTKCNMLQLFKVNKKDKFQVAKTSENSQKICYQSLRNESLFDKHFISILSNQH